MKFSFFYPFLFVLTFFSCTNTDSNPTSVTSNKDDFFPLSLNNTWKYKFEHFNKSNAHCVGIPYALSFGYKEWEVTDIISGNKYEISEHITETELDPILDGNGCLIRYDTLETHESSSKWYLKEKQNHQLVGVREADIFTGSEVFRFYPDTSANKIRFIGTIQKETDYNIELGELKRNIGLIRYYYKFGSSSHYYTFIDAHLIEHTVE